MGKKLVSNYWHKNQVKIVFLYFTRELVGIEEGSMLSTFIRVRSSKENFAMVNVSVTIGKYIGVGMSAYRIIMEVSHSLLAMDPVSILTRITSSLLVETTVLKRMNWSTLVGTRMQ